MKTIAFAALAGSLALIACSPADEATEAQPADTGDTTIINEAPDAAAPVVVDEADPEGSSLTIDGGDVDATVSEDGIEAEIKVD